MTKHHVFPPVALRRAFANLEMRRIVGSYDRLTNRAEPCYEAAAGVVDVLAGGPIRGGLQARPALSLTVAEQPPAPTPVSLPDGMTTSDRGERGRLLHRPGRSPVALPRRRPPRSARPPARPQ